MDPLCVELRGNSADLSMQAVVGLYFPLLRVRCSQLFVAFLTLLQCTLFRMWIGVKKYGKIVAC